MKTEQALRDLPAFEKAFFTSAFWTADDNAPGGMDYRITGNADELWEELSPINKKTLLYALHDWKIQHEEVLARAGDDEQNGHDLWLTQAGHGTGFWDRGYPDALGEALTDASHRFGELHCVIDESGVFIE